MDTELKNKTVLLIADYNVKVDNDEIRNTFKITQTYNTIDNIIKKSPRLLTVTTHLGRPKNNQEFSTFPIFKFLKQKYENIIYLGSLLNINKQEIKNQNENFYFTDNLRYYNSNELIVFFNSFDVIINDAFGAIHRASSFKAYPGLLMKKELKNIEDFSNPDLIIMGGAKILDKINYIANYSTVVFLSGGLAQSVIKKMGYEIGKGSLFQDFNHEIIKNRVVFDKEFEIKRQMNSIIIPTVYKVLTQNSKCLEKSIEEIEIHDTIIDIGDQSLKILFKMIECRSKIFWNGPLGKYEEKEADSTYKLIKQLENSRGKVFVGGGETLDVVLKNSSIEKFFHVSTGGGAVLQYFSGIEMPGLKSLK